MDKTAIIFAAAAAGAAFAAGFAAGTAANVLGREPEPEWGEVPDIPDEEEKSAGYFLNDSKKPDLFALGKDLEENSWKKYNEASGEVLRAEPDPDGPISVDEFLKDRPGWTCKAAMYFLEDGKLAGFNEELDELDPAEHGLDEAVASLEDSDAVYWADASTKTMYEIVASQATLEEARMELEQADVPEEPREEAKADPERLNFEVIQLGGYSSNS